VLNISKRHRTELLKPSRSMRLMKKKEHRRRRVVFRLVRAQAGATQLLNLCVESVTRSEKQREKRFIQMRSLGGGRAAERDAPRIRPRAFFVISCSRKMVIDAYACAKICPNELVELRKVEKQPPLHEKV
jgi:hypothetical protein